MKTSFFSLLAILAICFFTSNANGTTFSNMSLLPEEMQEIDEGEGGFFKFNFHFVRGMRNEAGICVGRGVCEIKFGFGILEVNPKGLHGELRKDRYENILFVIEKGGMTTDDSIDITGFATGPGTLQLSNNSDIPVEGKTKLGLPSIYQLKAGNYQVTETATTYIVNFGK